MENFDLEALLDLANRVFLAGGDPSSIFRRIERKIRGKEDASNEKEKPDRDHGEKFQKVLAA